MIDVPLEYISTLSQPIWMLTALFSSLISSSMADNQVALSRMTRAASSSLSKGLRQNVPPFLQKLYEFVSILHSPIPLLNSVPAQNGY